MQVRVNNRQPVAYLRKSRVTTERTVSWEVQEAAVRSMAPVPDTLLILSDWNRSGRGTSKRPGYRTLVEMIEGDQVSDLYSYSLSRLSRSLTDFSRLVDLCQAHDVTIHLYSERHLDFTTATGRLMVSILAAFAQMEAELGQERARDAVAVRRSRGDQIGPVVYGVGDERLDAVLEAYRETGSVAGAARMLTRRGVPTRRGGPWAPTSVRQILDREWPGVVPKALGRGRKAAAPFAFAGILLCVCGRRLTGARYGPGRQEGYVTYRCLTGRTRLDHGPQSVPETVVLAWAKEEMTHFRLPESTYSVALDEGRRDALNEKRRRILDNYEDGLLSKGERDEKLVAISEELELLDAAGRAVTVGEIDWDADPKALNEALRSLWAEVVMGPDQRPLRARWWFPEWRRD